MASHAALHRVAHHCRQILGLLPSKHEWIIKGFLSYIPGIYALVDQTRSASARYCYSVYMRHLVIAWEYGGLRNIPQTLLELGPGSSFGIGLAAILTGTNKYYAVDIIRHVDLQTNLKIFDELVRLFSERAAIPHGSEFSTEVRPLLSNYDFPFHILDDQYLTKCLHTDRIDSIRKTLERSFSEPLGIPDSPIQIFHVIPWVDEKIVPECSVDMIISNTTLEHVDNIKHVFEKFRYWLIDGGFMSHNIDCSGHGCSKKWNGHWAISKPVWSIMRGRRPYLVNREPYSTYLDLLKDTGFEVVCNTKFQKPSEITREELAREFQSISENDLNISGTLLQAIKR